MSDFIQTGGNDLLNTVRAENLGSFLSFCAGEERHDAKILHRLLAHVRPNWLTKDGTVEVGRALHQAYAGHESGLTAWHTWTQRGNLIYTRNELTLVWRGFGDPEVGIDQGLAETADSTTEYLKTLEIDGYKLSEALRFGMNYLIDDRGDGSTVTSDVVERFYAAIAVEIGKSMGYWYRRTEIAETALEPFSDLHKRIADPAIRYHAIDEDHDGIDEACEAAHAVLAERRKGPEKNLEDEARDRRQTKFFNFAKRTWGEIAANLEQRATRGLEEQLELTDAIRVAYIKDSDSGPDSGEADISQEGRKRYLKRLCKDLIKHVVRNPAGDVAQELGGVAVTTMATAEAFGLSVAVCERDEFARVLAKPRKELQDRHNAKPR